MSVPHLAKLHPSLLSFVRAFLWQLLRTGQIAEASPELQPAADAARAIFSVGRDRDGLWRLFGEYRQWVEHGNSAVLSDTLRSVLTPERAEEKTDSPAEPVAAESSPSLTEEAAPPPVEAATVESVTPPTADEIPTAAAQSEALQPEAAQPEEIPTETAAAPALSAEPGLDAQEETLNSAEDGLDAEGQVQSDDQAAPPTGSEPESRSSRRAKRQKRAPL